MTSGTRHKETMTSPGLKDGWKSVMGALSRHKTTAVALVLFGILSAIGNGVIPFITGRLIDTILVPNTVYALGITFTGVTFLLAVWFLIQIIISTLDWQIRIRSENIGAKTRYEFVISRFSRLYRLPLSFHKENKIGEVGNKVTMSAGYLERIFQNIVIELTPQFLTLLVAILIGIHISVTLTLLLVVGVLIYIAIVAVQVKPLAALQKKVHKLRGIAYGDAFDTLMNTKAVKAAVMEDEEHEKLERNFKGNIIPVWMRMFGIWQHISFSQRIIILLTQLAVFVVSISLVRSGVITIGDLIAFNSYAGMVFGPFAALGRMWEEVQNGLIDIAETDHLLSAPTEEYTPRDAKNTEHVIRGDVTFENVSFSYNGGEEVLRNISFAVRAGQKVALVGKSGEGKSTLVDLISAFMFPSKGVVRVDGMDTQNIPLRDLRSHIGLVPQEPVLFNASVRENVTYGRKSRPSEKRLRDALRMSHSDEFIDKLDGGLDTTVGERGIKLSAGQKQRIAIARAILQDPSILILDEPTSALDALSEKHITNALQDLMKGRTTFIIAHRLSTVRSADLIIVLKDGQVHEVGKHSDLLDIEDGVYRKFHDLQGELT